MYFNTNTKEVNSVFVHRVARVYELNPTTLATTSLCTLEASLGNYPLGLLTEHSGPLSIKDNSFANNLKIYPNPSNGTFNIEIDENLMGANGFIYNSIGQKIKQFKIDALKISNTLESGIYLLEIVNNNQRICKKIIVK